VLVTFAGSPDRAEAQLVPDAGFELDTFRVSGFPRQLSPALIHALGQALAAPRACRAILCRRRPDVVLGGGGYVAGPMVPGRVDADPAAIAEADAHLGLANRLAVPLAQRVFLAYPLAGRSGPRYRVVGRPIPARARPVSQAEGREIFELPSTGPVLLIAGALAGARSINDLVVESFGEVGPAILHITGDRDYGRAAVSVPTTADRRPTASVRRIPPQTWRARAAGLGNRRGGKPAAGAVSVRTADRQAKNAGTSFAGGTIMVRELDLGDVPDACARARRPDVLQMGGCVHARPARGRDRRGLIRLPA
jgi:hypothetical protein